MMIGIILYFLVIPAGVFALLWLFRVRAKKYLIGYSIAIILIPTISGFGFYAFRSPIQQGKFFPQFGPFLSLLFPAEDLYTPLVERPLSKDKNHYAFNVSHKYLGNHAVYIEIYSDFPPGFEIENSINLKVEISEGDNKLFAGSSSRGSPFRGKDVYGFYYVGYSVPFDSPTSKILTAKVEIKNDLKGFLKKHKKAKLVIRKASDL